MGSSVDDRPLIEAVDEGVLTLTLNRPEQRNALDTDLRDALAGALDRSHPLSELMDAVERLEKPVVAAIDGIATGAGLTLALACDWRVASTRARLLFREGRLNLVPTHGGVTRMLRRAPLSFGAAKRLLQVAADSDAHSTMLAESLAQTMLLAADDHREGLGAVRERREPEFTAR